MKRFLLFFALLAPLGAGAQTFEFGGRASVGADWKIIKGLHLSVEEEVRADGNFASLGSLRTSVGLSYKPLKFLKLSAGYTLINPWKTSAGAFNTPRHRAWFDLTGYLSAGDFQFSLRERVQYTHRTGDFNIYQTTPDLFALKTRLGVKYKRWKRVVPGLSVEMRASLNEPWGYYYGTEATTKAGKTYYPYQHTGYSHAYINRLRTNLGVEIKLSRHHTLSPALLLDYGADYEIDTNAAGTRLFGAGYNRYLCLQACLSYTVRF